MNKYKLINTQTKKEHLCDKVTIDGFDYYVSKETPTHEDCKEGVTKLVWGINVFNSIYTYYRKGEVGMLFDKNRANEYKRIIACNNPNIDIPKIVDEVDVINIAEKILKSHPDFEAEGMNEYQNGRFNGIIEGYNKSQETHPFSEENIKSFATHFYTRRLQGIEETIDSSLKVWKEQQPKIVYYE